MKQYILKLIDADIADNKKCLQQALVWIEKSKATDDYWQRRIKILEKKIFIANKCRDKILKLL